MMFVKSFPSLDDRLRRIAVAAGEVRAMRNDHDINIVDEPDWDPEVDLGCMIPRCGDTDHHAARDRPNLEARLYQIGD